MIPFIYLSSISAERSFLTRLFWKNFPEVFLFVMATLNSNWRTIPHLAALFSDTSTGSITEAPLLKKTVFIV